MTDYTRITNLKNRPRITFALAALLCLSGGSALAQASVNMEGSCEKLVIAGKDITQNCKDKLTNSVARSRTTFEFSAWDGQTLSFSGVGAQQEATEMTDPLQPISMVVSSQKDDKGIVQSTTPAVGSCRFSQPEKGKTTITCEATGQGKVYSGIFITVAKSAEGAPQQ